MNGFLYPVVLFVLSKGMTQMARYTFGDIVYGNQYGIKSAVFVEVFRMVEQKVDAKTTRTTEYDLCQARTACSIRLI